MEVLCCPRLAKRKPYPKPLLYRSEFHSFAIDATARPRAFPPFSALLGGCLILEAVRNGPNVSRFPG